MPAVGTRRHEYGSVGHSVSLKGGLQPNSANYSDYYSDVIAARDGSIVNPCPFGCTDEELDEHGRCYHRIGVSADGKTFEREGHNKAGRLEMKIERRKIKGKLVPVLEKVDKRKHYLIRVTTSFLVYEDRPVPEGWLPPDAYGDEPPAETLGPVGVDGVDEATDELEGDDDGRRNASLPTADADRPVGPPVGVHLGRLPGQHPQSG